MLSGETDNTHLKKTPVDSCMTVLDFSGGRFLEDLDGPARMCVGNIGRKASGKGSERQGERTHVSERAQSTHERKGKDKEKAKREPQGQHQSHPHEFQGFLESVVFERQARGIILVKRGATLLQSVTNLQLSQKLKIQGLLHLWPQLSVLQNG